MRVPHFLWLGVGGQSSHSVCVCVYVCGEPCPAGHGITEVAMEAGEQGVLEAIGSGNIS